MKLSHQILWIFIKLMMLIAGLLSQGVMIIYTKISNAWDFFHLLVHLKAFHTDVKKKIFSNLILFKQWDFIVIISILHDFDDWRVWIYHYFLNKWFSLRERYYFFIYLYISKYFSYWFVWAISSLLIITLFYVCYKHFSALNLHHLFIYHTRCLFITLF